jgi:hypothetical protein
MRANQVSPPLGPAPSRRCGVRLADGLELYVRVAAARARPWPWYLLSVLGVVNVLLVLQDAPLRRGRWNAGPGTRIDGAYSWHRENGLAVVRAPVT